LKANYKNWVPKGMICSVVAAAVLTSVLVFIFSALDWIVLSILCGFAALFCFICAAILFRLYRAFDYNGHIQLSRKIIEGIASYVHIPDGGVGLDVGCGSGALTIACAKANPKATMLGVDRWGKEYASFSKELCRNNAKVEGITNAAFEKGNAVSLDFADSSFDVVTSNYVYHNIPGKNKQDLLLETLRVLKKGGTFAIHDIMSAQRYGNMDAFLKQLRDMGFEKAELIYTDDGLFMSARQAKSLFLKDSALLVGIK